MNMRNEGISDADLDRFEKVAEPIYRSTATAGKVSRFQVSDLGMWVIRLVAEVRSIRRSEVAQPTAAREFLKAALAESDADVADGGAGWDVEVDARTVLGLLDEAPEAQGEPSDAQVLAACRAWSANAHLPAGEAMRAAVRAAGGVR